MHRLAFLALTIAAVAAACGGSSEQPTPTPDPTQPAFVTATPEPALTPSPTTRPAPTPARTATPILIDGAPIRALIEVAPTVIDGFALYIETGCFNCDGWATGITRVYRGTSGEIREDRLFDAKPGHDIIGIAFSPDGQRIALSTCDQFCGRGVSLPGARSLRASIAFGVSSLHLSDDGGITWRVAAVFDDDSGVSRVGFIDDEITMWVPSSDSDPRYWLYPSTAELSSPGLRFLSGARGRAWFMDGDRYLDADGREIPNAGLEGYRLSMIVSGPNNQTAVVWELLEPRRASWIVSTLDDDLQIVGTWTGSGSFPNLFGWDEPGRLYGNLTTGIVSQPVFIDIGRGTLSPIDVPAVEYTPEGSDLWGRNLIRAVLSGPFARVVNSDTCLNVRAEPTTDAAILGCYADAVLLRTTLETTEADSRIWLTVTTPAGESGWAAAEFLEYR